MGEKKEEKMGEKIGEKMRGKMGERSSIKLTIFERKYFDNSFIDSKSLNDKPRMKIVVKCKRDSHVAINLDRGSFGETNHVWIFFNKRYYAQFIQR